MRYGHAVVKLSFKRNTQTFTHCKQGSIVCNPQLITLLYSPFNTSGSTDRELFISNVIGSTEFGGHELFACVLTMMT